MSKALRFGFAVALALAVSAPTWAEDEKDATSGPDTMSDDVGHASGEPSNTADDQSDGVLTTEVE